MKRLLLIPILTSLFLFPRCNALKNLGLVPSELEMALALKEALSQGLFRSFEAFADPNGNPLVRFVFPGAGCRPDCASIGLPAADDAKARAVA